MGIFGNLLDSFASTVFDILPIAVILLLFQALAIRKKPPHLKRILIGFLYVLIGLSLFLVGLGEALFPLGKTMARQLTDPAFLGVDPDGPIHWRDYFWVYIFAAAVGFSTTVAEPALIAVTLKAEELSGGAMRAFGLRIAVAVGVAFGVGLGAYRIVDGTPLPYYIIVGYMIVIAQTFFSSKSIIPLAYDTGGVTTSTVTVPVITALGIGLASTIPGRNPLIDGFGLIAFASVFPIVSVLGYDMVVTWLRRFAKLRSKENAP